jgi:F-type H+-transporting ATPase subunit gamma
VKSTRKITSAMKMVAASQAAPRAGTSQASQPYARPWRGMLSRVAAGVTVSAASPKLLIRHGV